MSALTKYITLDFQEQQCCECGVYFCMTSYLHKERLKTHEDFYCPNGHSQHFAGETEAQKLQKQLDQEKKRREWAETEKGNLEKKLKKANKRTACGVCPCCNRSFVQLARHMKTKHPEFAKND